MTIESTGGCRCGGVRWRTAAELRDVWYCHCEDCRRITGHHMAATSAAADALNFDSDSTLSWYSAQPGVHYGFCSACGATIFWRADDKPSVISICAGSIDPPTGLRVGGVLFADEINDYVTDRPDVPTQAGDRSPVD